MEAGSFKETEKLVVKETQVNKYRVHRQNNRTSRILKTMKRSAHGRDYGRFAKYNLTLMKVYAKNHPNAFILIKK